MLDLHVFIYNQYNTINYARQAERRVRKAAETLFFIYSPKVQQDCHKSDKTSQSFASAHTKITRLKLENSMFVFIAQDEPRLL